jgi:regulator of ribonuclease activity A
MAIDPKGVDLKRFLAEDPGGPVVMLNLLRFAPGKTAHYQRYVEAFTPFAQKVGAELVYAGDGSSALVAETGQAWDAVLLVRYPSRKAFSDMVRDPGYHAISHLRTESLVEAVLQATTEWPRAVAADLATPTADLCDRYEDEIARGRVRVLEPGFVHFGTRRAFSGPASTLAVHEDNALVRKALEEPGAGRVLVIDGGGSRRCALVGGNLGALAVKNGWAGIVVSGCVRDTAELSALPLGVRALRAHPQKAKKRGVGERDVIVRVGGATVSPGDAVHADADGIVVVDAALAR